MMIKRRGETTTDKFGVSFGRWGRTNERETAEKGGERKSQITPGVSPAGDGA